MTLPSTARLRIAAIDFLNPAPLMWDFEHPPLESALAERYAIERMTPAECAQRLAAGTADIGLIPAAAYAFNPELQIIPGCTIASLDRVRSILLVLREGAISYVKTVAADTSSRTSLAYAQILFQKYWKPAAAVEFREHPPNLDRMLQAADAALLIGDPALLALEDRQARLDGTGERLEYLDLAHEWRSFTGLPWVSAFWAVRPQALESRNAATIVEDFQHSRDHGMANIDALVAEWTPRIGVPAGTIRSYLTENIHYVLDEDCLRGLRGFYDAAAECSILPATRTLNFL